jgi:ANTAR domain/GAF domain
MSNRDGYDVGTLATAQSLRAALLGVAQAVATGDLDRLVRWCLDCCTTLLGATAAAVVDLDRAAGFEQRRVTATDASVRELIELDLDLPTGACRDCLATGEPTTIPDLALALEPWAELAAGARELRFTWIHADPLRLRGDVIGSLHLFGDATQGPEELDIELAHAVAELALGTGAQQHVLDERSTEVAQLHNALSSRLVIEQAKGILAARHGIDVEHAFARLRKHARDHRRNIHDVARDVVQHHAPELT